MKQIDRRATFWGIALAGAPALARPEPRETVVRLPFENGERPLVAYPQKRPLLRLTTRPPQLETPFQVFDEGPITANDAFFVRYHLAATPPADLDPAHFRLKVQGLVDRTLSLGLDELKRMPTTEVVAVNQCSGNSRGFFAPRVAGGQAGNGLMGAAVWRGVSLKRVLDRAGVKAGAVDVRFDGMDGPVDPATPSGIAQVLVSADSGVTWTPARLGKDLGRYSFRQWSTTLRLPVGGHQLRVQAISRSGERQPAEPRWNPAGYRRNVIESVSVQAA